MKRKYKRFNQCITIDSETFSQISCLSIVSIISML
jgi:hypothetical protein